MSLPRIAISVGDPFGIGPEVVVAALADPGLRSAAQWVIHGSSQPMLEAAEKRNIEPWWYRVDFDGERQEYGFTHPAVLIDEPLNGNELRQPGPSELGGLLSKQWVERAVADTLRPATHPRHADALVTAPICKSSWRLAGYHWPGHTELLAHRCQSKPHAMGFVAGRLKIVLATCHQPLETVCETLSIGRVHDCIGLGVNFARQLGLSAPRIAVCGINPHAGEQGLLGDEEQRIIEPAIELAQHQWGSDSDTQITGPWPGDTVWKAALTGKHDVVIAMYHDQGLIPAKLLAPEGAVNLTLGLPVVRTSPDHGTAFDIAGQGKADPSSLKKAIELALDLIPVGAAP
ncbi:MAG: 4-hydroxythreonine-4-phosphate dehydrogenase PdxA [Phycisphaerae bacterium]|jgi:4-hydroxythreonine-4-phosphate dehydrogenase|nr:4-hydroxythreonine-4-phosphate dehydrogenase PdxA [Phycisphaerae bacterium]